MLPVRKKTEQAHNIMIQQYNKIKQALSLDDSTQVFLKCSFRLRRTMTDRTEVV